MKVLEIAIETYKVEHTEQVLNEQGELVVPKEMAASKFDDSTNM